MSKLEQLGAQREIMSEHEIKRQQRIAQRLAWLEKGEPFDVKGFIEDVRALLEATRSTIAAPQIIEIETTPILIDFESTAAKYRTDIIKALHKAGAPMCHEDGQLMSAVEQINWLAAKSVAAPAQEVIAAPAKEGGQDTPAAVSAGDLYAVLRNMHWTDSKLAVIEVKDLRLGVQTYSGELLDAAIVRATTRGEA